MFGITDGIVVPIPADDTLTLQFLKELEATIKFWMRPNVEIFYDEGCDMIYVATHKQNRRRVNPRSIDVLTPLIFRTKVIYVSHQRLREMKHGRLAATKSRDHAGDGKVCLDAHGSSGRQERIGIAGAVAEVCAEDFRRPRPPIKIPTARNESNAGDNR